MTTTACRNPFMRAGQAYGCGQCLPCRIKKRREWAHRIQLEQGLKPDNNFLTLTYEKAPDELTPADMRAFLDNLRHIVGYGKFRYFGVGEYGDDNFRPHMHLVLFGYPSCLKPRHRGDCSCKTCAPIHQAWGRGFITNDPLTPERAQYIAKYTIKKMTRSDDPRLGNKHPEFTRMSLKPGIGAGIVEALAELITRYSLLTPQGDVPVTLRHGTQQMPLGRYLRKKLRERLGLDARSPHVLSPEASYAHFHSDDQADMRALLHASLIDPKTPSLKAQLLNASRERSDQIERRHKLFAKKGKL